MPLGRPLIRFDSLPSTMDTLSALAVRGAAEGTTVVADLQTQGRGRRDRRWETPAGTALLASVLLRPPVRADRLTSLALLVADAIAAALDDRLGVQASIKWPNDLLVNGEKLVGILIQTRVQPDKSAWVNVGFGINANISPQDLPPGATSLFRILGATIDRDALLRAVLDGLEERYGALLHDDLSAVWPDIERRLAMRDELVTVVQDETSMRGHVKGVDTSGALLLRTTDGTLHRLLVGDVVRGPRPVSSRTR